MLPSTFSGSPLFGVLSPCRCPRGSKHCLCPEILEALSSLPCPICLASPPLDSACSRLFPLADFHVAKLHSAFICLGEPCLQQLGVGGELLDGQQRKYVLGPGTQRPSAPPPRSAHPGSKKERPCLTALGRGTAGADGTARFRDTFLSFWFIPLEKNSIHSQPGAF